MAAGQYPQPGNELRLAAVIMHVLMLITIVAVTTFPYLAEREWLPRILVFTPEIVSLVVAIYVVVVGVQSRFQYVRPVYWLVFGGLAICVISGAIVNQLQPGPMFAGIRTYLRAIPFFFLPAVLLISNRQLRVQLTLLLVICLVQLPVAGRQRWLAEQLGSLRGSGWASGDYVVGTLMGSGLLTMFLIGAACVLTGFYLRQGVSTGRYLSLVLLILLPTTLNETKVTLFMLPIAMLTTFVVGSSPGARLKNVAIGIILTGCFVAIFIPIYDYFMVPRWGYGLIDFFLMEGRMDGYLASGAEIGDQPIRRSTFDSILVVLKEISGDPMKSVFGVGIGNGQHSQLGAQFTGEYFQLFSVFAMKFLALTLLELGFLGTSLILLLHVLIFLDCISLAQSKNRVISALAVGWSGVSALIAIGMIYTSLIGSAAFGYLYWYFSGLIAASAMRYRFDKSTETASLAGGDHLGRTEISVVR